MKVIDGGGDSLSDTRMERLLAAEPAAAALVERLVNLAIRGLPLMSDADTGRFAFTRVGVRGADGMWRTSLRGHSTRYAAITALGVRLLPEERQRVVLHGQTSFELTGQLTASLPGVSNLGDVALVTWAAAEHGHPSLGQALARLRQLDTDLDAPVPVVEAAWVLAALVATTDYIDVTGELARARARLLAGRAPRSPLFGHATGPGLLPWYREHVGCYADQVYPIQALARLHTLTGDQEALTVAANCARRICDLQGAEGQWWWHYDARTGRVIEGFPVYSVHQHAMGPMALLDLEEAGGGNFDAAIRRGLHWMVDRPETPEPMVLDDLALTWRKVARADSRKLVRGARGLTTRVHPSMRIGVLDRLPTTTVDHECRPYEFGWLLYAWGDR
jgi:hypothetical protein